SNSYARFSRRTSSGSVAWTTISGFPTTCTAEGLKRHRPLPEIVDPGPGSSLALSSAGNPDLVHGPGTVVEDDRERLGPLPQRTRHELAVRWINHDVRHAQRLHEIFALRPALGRVEEGLYAELSHRPPEASIVRGVQCGRINEVLARRYGPRRHLLGKESGQRIGVKDVAGEDGPGGQGLRGPINELRTRRTRDLLHAIGEAASS